LFRYEGGSAIRVLGTAAFKERIVGDRVLEKCLVIYSYYINEMSRDQAQRDHFNQYSRITPVIPMQYLNTTCAITDSF